MENARTRVCSVGKGPGDPATRCSLGRLGWGRPEQAAYCWHADPCDGQPWLFSSQPWKSCSGRGLRFAGHPCPFSHQSVRICTLGVRVQCFCLGRVRAARALGGRPGHCSAPSAVLLGFILSAGESERERRLQLCPQRDAGTATVSQCCDGRAASPRPGSLPGLRGAVEAPCRLCQQDEWPARSPAIPLELTWASQRSLSQLPFTGGLAARTVPNPGFTNWPVTSVPTP